MTRLLAALSLICWTAMAHAQTSSADAPVEPVSTVYTVLFLIAFVGGTVGVGWYMWWSDKKSQEGSKEAGQKAPEKPAK